MSFIYTKLLCVRWAHTLVTKTLWLSLGWKSKDIVSALTFSRFLQDNIFPQLANCIELSKHYKNGNHALVPQVDNGKIN